MAVTEKSVEGDRAIGPSNKPMKLAAAVGARSSSASRGAAR